MTTLSVDSVVACVRADHPGQRVAAIFDFEGTLIATRPTVPGESGHAVDEQSFAERFEQSIRLWIGRTEDELREEAEQLFVDGAAAGLIYGCWRLVRAHQNQGHMVVLVTSGTRMEAEPFARELGIDHVLYTAMATEGGVVTGQVAGRPLWGDGKLAAVSQFATRNNIDLRQCHAYANGDEDIALLDAVGSPHPVNPEAALRAHADRSGWSSLEIATQPARRGPAPALRTAAMFGSLLAAAGVGAVVGVATRDHRRGVDLATTLFGRAAGPLGAIKFDVTGGEHSQSHRPAVFFVNHQSGLIDMLVASRVVRRGFTVVAKAEIRKVPVVGRMFDLAGVAFVNRSDTSAAISALQPALDKLRDGVSIAIAPEGTRSLTPTIGPFKKGGFHLARDAQVPIVPIVIRNAGEIMWRNSMIAQAGTIEVAVHQPLPTDGWSRNDINTWLPQVRQLYVDTLDDWPGVEAGRQWSLAIAAATSRGT
ncbi:HAD-IB family hydrolase [Mycobacterium sp.]|uniref:HAD-IB family hydrolase n=1 Tax=Mycobacterium sp. TaxID=1785 RepID=UPI003D0C15A0